ncbi:MAG TPA: MFS transporter [Methylomirabilota bacterium]|jgi:AAA family ATP:ADP antiporter|nr:MFS transporter [Methylomirabilota bacterium]
MTGALGRRLRRGVDVREAETAALAWSCAYFFFVLSAYYVIRPVRDEMGVAGGVENLAWLFTGTLVGMLAVHPLFTALVARLPRRRFVPLVYRFFILNLVVFFLLLRAADPAQHIWIGRVFFVWTSVFNLFVVSVFWSLMTDLYRPAQSQRLFGLVAVGGTAGAILGSSITAGLVSVLGPTNLLLVSALLLEIAAWAARAVDRQEGRLAGAARETGEDPGRPVDDVIGGGLLDGIRDVLRSPYLIAISGLVLLFTITSTFLYFEQAAIVRALDRAARTRLFANMDLAVNVLTLVTQVFLTGRLLRWVGLGVGLAVVPLLTGAGFAVLGAAPVVSVLVVFSILRRAANFAVQRPAREVLYTVLPRTEKYKAKNFSDTFVYRLGDQLGAWSYTALAWTGLGIAALGWMMVPVSTVWLVLALWLGRRYVRRHS